MYRWAEHTGELQLDIECESERGVFEEGFRALCELLAGEGAGSAAPRGSERPARLGEPMPPRLIVLQARDRAALLADWLGELSVIAEEGIIPLRLASLELSGSRLEAVLEGARGEPPHLVKAATYHRLSLAPHDRGWRASVVLDV